jgi:hypothetical protein
MLWKSEKCEIQRMHDVMDLFGLGGHALARPARSLSRHKFKFFLFFLLFVYSPICLAPLSSVIGYRLSVDD